VLPLSIPSPDADWRILANIGDWIRGIGWTSFPFDVNIHAYAICILLGIVIAIWLTNRRLTARGAEPWVILDVAIWAVLLGLLGARLYHVATHPGDFFGENFEFWRIFAIWEGGNAIFGSLLGGAVGVLIACRITGLRFWTVADAIAPGLLLAQVLGRLGNWFNQELFGLPTDLPWGLEIDRPNAAIPSGIPDDALFHPTFAYEMLWNAAGVVLILVAERRLRLQWGRVFALYLIWYGAGRTWFESIRLDPSELFLGVRSNVWAAVIAVVLGVVLLLLQRRRHPGLEPSPYLPGREWSPSAEVDSPDTYSDTEDQDSTSETGDAAGSEADERVTSSAAAGR
jgi:prolipoprotein diacylglyceryl transferase